MMDTVFINPFHGECGINIYEKYDSR